MNNTIYNISQIFASKGVKRMVLSPGSRNAPLTISFARNPAIETFNIVDERSSAFIALGMAIKSRSPVAICCTSGSALLNYAPAASEAYYQHIPLIIVSADRPPEAIGKRDGQTINQVGALANFVKGSFNLSCDLGDEKSQTEFNETINQAINLATTAPFGPVHINVPFREPFYPNQESTLKFHEPQIIKPQQSANQTDLDSLIEKWNAYNKKLILIGQNSLDTNLNDALKGITVPVVADIIGNVDHQGQIHSHDLFLGQLDEDQIESLTPELLITTGKSIISKNLKLFLRNNKPKAHWHFEDTDKIADTFDTITAHYKTELSDFLLEAKKGKYKDEFNSQVESNFLQHWTLLDKKTTEEVKSMMINAPFSEAQAYHKTMGTLPSQTDLHLANSMAVRYANFFQFAKTSIEIETYANRGTSGIDGSNGAAVGNAIIGDKNVVLLTGDLSFFYDRNAFFHSYDLRKLKIIVFNNQGGGIFRLIKGPSTLPELDQHFETRHHHSASFTAAEYGFDYYRAENLESLSNALHELFKDSKTPKLLEVFTEPEINSMAYKSIQNAIFKKVQKSK